MNLREKIAHKLANWIYRIRFSMARALLPCLSNLSDAQLSLVNPVRDSMPEDESHRDLLELALVAARGAMSVDLSDVTERISFGQKWPDVWPGEHYKLLAMLTTHIKPRSVVEIGTFLGLSALAIKKFLPKEGRIITFDVLPWQSFSNTCLRESDFSDGRLEQVIADLSQPDLFKEHAELLARADMIFIDGPKNRTFERAFLQQLGQLKLKYPKVVVIDDIKLWSMLDIWEEIPFPKLDITSLGHFSGTGIVKLAPK